MCPFPKTAMPTCGTSNRPLWPEAPWGKSVQCTTCTAVMYMTRQCPAGRCCTVQLSLSQLGPVSAALSRHCGVTLHGFPGGTEDVQPQLGSQWQRTFLVITAARARPLLWCLEADSGGYVAPRGPYFLTLPWLLAGGCWCWLPDGRWSS